MSPEIADLIAGVSESGKVDAHGIQPFYAGLVARECGLTVETTLEVDVLSFVTRPLSAATEANAA